MLIRDFMTVDPVFVTPHTDCEAASELMRERDCGALPVVESMDSRRLVGIVTDRDLVCRALAIHEGRRKSVQDVMSSPVVTLYAETPWECCIEAMSDNQVRRLVVVDKQNKVIGIVSVADVTRVSEESVTGALMKQLSTVSRTGLA